jgi:hypothetical protein
VPRFRLPEFLSQALTHPIAFPYFNIFMNKITRRCLVAGTFDRSLTVAAL